jgi:hypothetical protein
MREIKSNAKVAHSRITGLENKKRVMKHSISTK